MPGDAARPTIRVRPAGAHDAPFLSLANRALARETEDTTLDPDTVDEGVRTGIGDPERARYFIAEMEGTLAGCLMVTREWSDWRNKWMWWIQSVYVEPRCRRRGVYRALHGAVLEAAARAGDVALVRLYVERENRAAIAVYERLGMRPARYQFLEQEVRPVDPA